MPGWLLSIDFLNPLRNDATMLNSRQQVKVYRRYSRVFLLWTIMTTINLHIFVGRHVSTRRPKDYQWWALIISIEGLQWDYTKQSLLCFTPSILIHVFVMLEIMHYAEHHFLGIIHLRFRFCIHHNLSALTDEIAPLWSSGNRKPIGKRGDVRERERRSQAHSQRGRSCQGVILR